MKVRNVLFVAIAFLALVAARDTPEKGQTARNGDVSIWFEVRGNRPGTALLVINGGPGLDHTILHASDAWDLLARRRKLVFYDQRGTGRSGPLRGGQSCTLADQVADLEALRAHLGFDRVDLLGHSWGGFLAMAYAARYPERIAHLILVDSAAPKFSETAFLFRYVYPETAERQDAMAPAAGQGEERAVKAFIEANLSMLFYSPEKREEFIRKSRPASFAHDVSSRLVADLVRSDLTAELPKFRFPTLVITGRHDANVAPSVAWGIHKAIRGSRFVAFERSGHMPFFEEPRAFVEAVETFLAGR